MKFNTSNKLLIVLLSALLVSACGDEANIINKTDTGKLISTTEITTSWNDSHRTKITTVKGVFYVNRIVSAMKDSATWIDEYDNGHKYICIDGNNSCLRVIGN
jgi:hypothetical protein